MGQRIIITESEKNQIRSLYEQTIQGQGNDPYEYKKEGNKYFARKKGSPTWVLSKGTTSDAIATKIFKTTTTTPKTTPETKTSSLPFKNSVEGNQFREWVNNTHPDYAKSIGLDRRGSHTNSYIQKAWLKYGLQYKTGNRKIPFKKGSSKMISVGIDPVSVGIDAVVVGFKKWVRKTYPNISQLFFARNLLTDDFSGSQLEEIRKIVKNAIKRTGKKSGGTEYADYGSNVVNKWFGEGGVKTTDMISNTILADPKFMIATTLGRFSYAVQNGQIKISDIYDFKKIPDANTEAKDLRSLSYPQKVMRVMSDNSVNPYVAIRHLGYLEYPEESSVAKPKINIELPLEATA